MSELAIVKENQLEVLAPTALEAITRGEVDVQIATAHKYPRSMQKFKQRATDMATIDQETAESCIYVRPVGGGKFAEGLSVRMAEIIGASYGNLRVGSMIVEQTERYVVCRGFAHDLETNFASTSEVKEPTVMKNGSPYSEGQRAVVAKAALSKARRDATFQVVPKALCRPIETAARALIAGDAKSFDSRRTAAVQYLQRLGIDMARVWAIFSIAGEADLSSDHLMTLTGIRNAIKDGDSTIDEAFPVIVPKGNIGAPVDDAKPKPTPEKSANPKPKPQPEREEPAPSSGSPSQAAPPQSAAAESPAAQSAGPSLAENRATVLRLIGTLNIGKKRFAASMVEQGMEPEGTAFDDVSASTLQAVVDGWDEIKDKLPPQ